MNEPTTGQGGTGTGGAGSGTQAGAGTGAAPSGNAAGNAGTGQQGAGAAGGGAAAGAGTAGGGQQGTITRAQQAAGGMGPEALSIRLKRERDAERKRVLGELGTDDPEKVKQALARLAELEKVQNERQRAEMSDLQKVQADLQAANEKIATLEAENATLKQGQTFAKQDQIVKRIAGQFVNEQGLRLARIDFREMLNELSAKEQGLFTDRDAQKYFRDWVKENPQFALAAGATAGANGAGAAGAKQTAGTSGAGAGTGRERRFVNNGQSARRATPAGSNGGVAPPAGQGDPPGTYKGKVVQAGKPNSMSKAELREYAKANGLPSPL